MSPRALARGLLVGEAVLLLAATLLALPHVQAVPPALAAVPILAYGWLGARIAERAPRNRIGWLLSAAASSAALFLFLRSYTYFGIEHGASPLPLTRPLAWLFVLLPLPVILPAFPLVFLSFPTGRVPSIRWRPAAVLAPAAGLTLLFAFLSKPAMVGGDALGLRGPGWTRSVTWWDGAGGGAVALFTLAVLAGLAALTYRTRRGPVADRPVIRGLLFTLLAMVASLPFSVFLGWLGWTVMFLVNFTAIVFVIPLALAVALLRHGLYEYELGVRKTIAAGILVLSIVGVFLFLLLFLSQSLGLGRRTPGWAIFAFALVIGLSVPFVARRARRFADRVVYGDRATPYEVLSEFADRLGDTYSRDDVLPRMTQLVAAGTGATVARVWLLVDRELRAIQVWPNDAPPAASLRLAGEALPDFGEATIGFPVRHQGELLGAIAVSMPPNDPMNAKKEKLVRDLAGQAGLVLRNVRLVEDLRESRRRIVTAQDERARALERDIHDGAQQQLVALAVKMRLAHGLVKRDPDKAETILSELQSESNDALANLRDLARGIYPPLLADKGLVAALEAQTRKTPVTVAVLANGIPRFSAEVEAAVYFCCLEALQNVAKYAGASKASIRLTATDRELAFGVSDDGVGFDATELPRGTGLQNMADRVEALGGTLEVRSAPGRGTTVSGRVPAQPATAAAQADSSRSGENTDLGM